MEGKRARGRPRPGMLDEIKMEFYVDMRRRTEDRVGWKSYVPWTCRKTELWERGRERSKQPLYGWNYLNCATVIMLFDEINAILLF